MFSLPISIRLDVIWFHVVLFAAGSAVAYCNAPAEDVFLTTGSGG